uniref:Uncharacterized protein n=1 Tax=Stomoxys calcitrans TaxID=35570 RepID=A0A1I8Q1X4_STOCA
MVQFRRNIATGCMVYLVMRHRVHVIGLVGTVQPPNNCALAVCSTMRMPTAVIGLKMSMVVKSILFAMMMPMVMFLWANPAIAIGNAKAVIHVCNVVRPCLSSIGIHCVALCHQRRNVIYQQPHCPSMAMVKTTMSAVAVNWRKMNRSASWPMKVYRHYRCRVKISKEPEIREATTAARKNKTTTSLPPPPTNQPTNHLLVHIFFLI